MSNLQKSKRFDLIDTFLISIQKILKSLQNYLLRNFEKHLESSSGHTLTCCLNLVKYGFKNMLRMESLTRFSTVI